MVVFVDAHLSQVQEEEPLPEGKKWRFLEHNGVIFPPKYEPHGVKMKYNGEPVNLTPDQVSKIPCLLSTAAAAEAAPTNANSVTCTVVRLLLIPILLL